MKQYIEHMSYIVTYTYKDIKKSKKLFLNCFDVCLHQSVFWLGGLTTRRALKSCKREISVLAWRHIYNI